MTNERARLMAWRPGSPGFNRDDIILSIGLQCGGRPFAVRDVVEWLGPPDKAAGDSSDGHLAYFYSGDAPLFAMFDVADGYVVGFGAMERFKPNACRKDEDTGEKVLFNILDEMTAFNPNAFE